MVVLIENIENKPQNNLLDKLSENIEVLKLNKTCETNDTNDDSAEEVNNQIETSSTTTEEDAHDERQKENDENIEENVKILLNDVLNLVENGGNYDDVKSFGSEDDEEKSSKSKGILKYKRTYSNKQVNFDENVQFIREYDRNKDYTEEIQFVEKLTKRVVSYAALYAQKKADDENAARKAAETAAAAEENHEDEDEDENLENGLFNKFKNVLVE